MRRSNTYELDCVCGKTLEIESSKNAGAIERVVCMNCGMVHDAIIPKLYRPYRKTLLIHNAILEIFGELTPKLTVRQIYYALTVRGVMPKTEQGYHQTAYHLGNMREYNLIPFDWIADNTRWHIKPTTYQTLTSALAQWQTDFRRNLWVDQPVHVEIWVEKDALASVISPITAEYDVPLYVARGYSSMTFIYDAAEQIKSIGKPTFIYHFGDFDPSGVDAAYKIRDGLSKHGAEIHFERVAITEDQINAMYLPTRPTKKSDPRSRKWGDKPSVELDALPAPVLRSLVRQSIEKHVDPILLEQTRELEEYERAHLAKFRENFELDRNLTIEEVSNE